jgi:hypothetical protein
MVDNCITEREYAQGYWWCYRHSPDESLGTLEMAIRLAGEVAATEARKRGKTYIVASTSWPVLAVYVVACDHPDAAKAGFHVMFEFTPSGELYPAPTDAALTVRAALTHFDMNKELAAFKHRMQALAATYKRQLAHYIEQNATPPG